MGTEKNWPECRWGRRRKIEAGRNREGKAVIALWKKDNNKASYASPTHRLCCLSKFQSKQSSRNRRSVGFGGRKKKKKQKNYQTKLTITTTCMYIYDSASGFFLGGFLFLTALLSERWKHETNPKCVFFCSVLSVFHSFILFFL